MRTSGITKQGNRYLPWLLVAGAMAVIRYAQKHGTKRRPWLGLLMEPAHEGGCGRAGQQDYGDGLGYHDPRGETQGADATNGGITDTTRQIGTTNWRGYDGAMQIRSFRGSQEPVRVIALL